MSKFTRYVNVYRVDQRFGGREEGGWWYDIDTVLETVKVDQRVSQRRVVEQLRQKYHVSREGRYALQGQSEHPDYEQKRARGRTSAAGGYDVYVCVEKERGQNSPLQRPRYE